MKPIWKIGQIEIANQVVLAPMAGVTDKAFRIIAKEQGCGLLYTEMISAKALTYNNQRTCEYLNISGEQQPIAIQLFGSEPEIMAEGAKLAVANGARLLDVNMGCPVPKVVRCGEGSALLERPDVAEKIVQAMVKAVAVPVMVKIRLGWDRQHIVAVEFAKRMEAAGVAAIAVHGRTREQYYAGKADWSIIGQVKRAVTIPVIGNGDIWLPEDGARMLAETGCDAIMIGRGVMGNPWLIGNTLKYLTSGEKGFNPTPRDKITMAIRHLDLMIGFKGEDIGVREMRSHLAWYLKGLPHSAAVKEAIFRAKKRAEVVELLTDYLSKTDFGVDT